MYRNELIDTLIENASSFSERNEITSLTEAEVSKISNVMVANLYQTILDKPYMDFDDIPRSKGNITNYKGYKSMISTLDIVKDIAKKSNRKIDEVEIIEKALSNLVAYKETFEKGFKLNKEFVVLQYNSLVSACVSATTKVLYVYMDYVRTVDSVEIVINKSYDDGNLMIDSLDKFNKLVSTGEFAKTMNFIIKNKNNNVSEGAVFEWVEFIAIPAVVLICIVALIKITRLIIFSFYNKKEELSRYLEMQAMFLELNKENINAQGNRIDPSKKKQILKKQERLIKKLRILADKLSVDDRLAAKKTVLEIKQNDSEIRIADVQSKAAQDDMGAGLQIL